MTQFGVGGGFCFLKKKKSVEGATKSLKKKDTSNRLSLFVCRMMHESETPINGDCMRLASSLGWSSCGFAARPAVPPLSR